MKFYTRDREAGNRIDEFNTRGEAERAIAAYEKEDVADGTYTPDFYEVEEVPEFRGRFKTARTAAGLTQKAISAAMLIPIRTIQEWEGGKRTPPPYVQRFVLNELQSLGKSEE